MSTTPVNLTQVPPTNAQPYLVVNQAQITSQANGGLKGIYAKANRDLNFSAEAKDVLGTWNCQSNGNELVYPANTSHQDIINNLVQHNIFYSNSTPPWCSSSLGGSDYSHVIAWDSSVQDLAQAPFNIRASVDLNGEASDMKVMRNFECKLDSSNLDSILKSILSKSTLKTWCATLQGVTYNGRFTPARNDSQSVLEATLNSIVMVAGGNDYFLNTMAERDTQGCLVNRTEIHGAVIALILAATKIALLMMCAWIVVIVLKRRCKKRLTGTAEVSLEEIEQSTPSDIFEWMCQAIREGRSNQIDIRPKNLRDWEFGFTENRHGLCLTQMRDEEQGFPLEGR